jgi:DNA-binding transcriptional ArsR family regulator
VVVWGDSTGRGRETHRRAPESGEHVVAQLGPPVAVMSFSSRDVVLVSRASRYYNRMVVDMAEAERADALFHALADPTRRDILTVVLQEAHSVSDLARRYPISFPAVHKHVGALERAGLVTKTRHGREQRVRGDVAALRSAHRLLDDLEALWRGRMDRIEQLLADPTEGARQCP